MQARPRGSPRDDQGRRNGLMNDIQDLYGRVGIANPSEPLDVPVRFRAEQSLVDDLDKLEASLRGAGYRVSRSDILRALVASALQGVQENFPLSEVRLPGASAR
jgi:hypothetical protein